MNFSFSTLPNRAPRPIRRKLLLGAWARFTSENYKRNLTLQSSELWQSDGSMMGNLNMD